MNVELKMSQQTVKMGWAIAMMMLGIVIPSPLTLHPNPTPVRRDPVTAECQDQLTSGMQQEER
jgi:hypothetical protein